MARRQVNCSVQDHQFEYLHAKHISPSDLLQKAVEEHMGKLTSGLEQQEKEARARISELLSQLAVSNASLISIQEERAKKHEEAQAIEEARKLKEKQCLKCGELIDEAIKKKFAGYCKTCFEGGGYKEALAKSKGNRATAELQG